MSMAMTLLSACADNNLGTDTERISHSENFAKDVNIKRFVKKRQNRHLPELALF